MSARHTSCLCGCLSLRYDGSMAIHDTASQRLYLAADLKEGQRIALSDDQMNYLVNVLRLRPGTKLLVFNGRHGEWQAILADVKKRSAEVVVEHQVRLQIDGPDIDYVFAPLKRARLDYVVQKATELGVARLRPVLTRRTIAERVNLERMRANAVEAAEQCGILWLPEIAEPVGLPALLSDWDGARRMIFCDESATHADPVEALKRIGQGPLAVLIGPEGGFDAQERDSLLAKSWVHAIGLGPRIMRADTAAVAALALVNATLGDWR